MLSILNFLLTLLILILMLGIIVFIHEFGHFLAAKKQGCYISEFAIGMGPKLFSFNRKNDETLYSVRMLPIGGFNAIQMTEEENKKTKKDRVFENKSFFGKIFILLNGVFFNLLLAMTLLFINGLLYGSPDTRAIIGRVEEASPCYEAGLLSGDVITNINGKNVNSWDDALLILQYGEKKNEYVFTVERSTTTAKIVVKPELIKNDEGTDTLKFGFTTANVRNKGLVSAVKYSFIGSAKIIRSLGTIIANLFTGHLGLKSLSGPVGIYSVIDTVKQTGLENIIYLTAYLSLNIGIINLLPVPVFDGGRVLLVVLEKIKGKKLNPKIEEWLDTIGFVLLLILMLYVTANDILKLF